MTATTPRPHERRAENGVVIHLDEDTPGKHEAVLRNISNLLEDITDDTTVELVAHGPGISIMLRNSPQAMTVQHLHDSGVQLVACANTMTGMGIGPDELATAVAIATSGVGQLVRRQQQGWAYVRP